MSWPPRCLKWSVHFLLRAVVDFTTIHSAIGNIRASLKVTKTARNDASPHDFSDLKSVAELLAGAPRHRSILLAIGRATDYMRGP
jgi:hypothetical protein